MNKKVNIKYKLLIEENTHTKINRCWTCSSCDTECPINIATNRLRPQKMVRLAYFGLFDELVSTPDVWYCITCRRCSYVCPNLVEPADVIAYARMEALRTGAVSHYQVQSYFELFSTFQRVRWHAAEKCVSGKLDGVDENQWFKWFEKPIPNSTVALSGRNLFQGNSMFNSLAVNTNTSSFFTCGECSSACPISGSRNVFDPRFIFRMANLDMLSEILSSPSIWLCLDCGRCTEACSQLVDGRQIIRDLQKLAIQSGAVDADISLRIRDANLFIYNRFLDEIDMEFKHPVRAVA